jgi:hypothetical protein
MADLSDVLKSLSQHPVLQDLSITQLLTFLTQSSALKRHIILAQPAGEPTGNAPQILPPLVREFLANGTGIALQAIQDAWDILKDHAWTMSPLADRAEMEKIAFREFGWSQGFSACWFLG